MGGPSFFLQVSTKYVLALVQLSLLSFFPESFRCRTPRRFPVFHVDDNSLFFGCKAPGPPPPPSPLLRAIKVLSPNYFFLNRTPLSFPHLHPPREHLVVFFFFLLITPIRRLSSPPRPRSSPRRYWQPSPFCVKPSFFSLRQTRLGVFPLCVPSPFPFPRNRCRALFLVLRSCF